MRGACPEGETRIVDVEPIPRRLRLPRGASAVVALAPMLVWLAVFPASGLETYPFLVLDVMLDDSADVVNIIDTR